jgi:serine/threonine protein phosphatase PrpC
MKIMPDENGTAATWHFEDESVQVAAVWTEKKRGRGEDGPPTALHHRGGRGMLAVYDGAGGAGARSIGRTPDDFDMTGAFIASRVTHFAFEDWFVDTVPHRRLFDPEGPHDAILDALRGTGIAPGKISGTMVRHLPTTLAAIEYEIAGRHLNLMVRWAGDSRAYILDVHHGLQVVTRDDAEDSDALILLTNDQPMNNIICADRPFRINRFPLRGVIDLPAVLICATDGFFNYVQTPAHFEHLLLDTMAGNPSMHAWAANLAEIVKGYSADDASLVIASFGYPTLDAMRLAFGERHRFVAHRYIRPLREISSENHAELAFTRQSSWDEYKGGYEKWLRQMEAG